MKSLSLFALTASFALTATAESHPSWWNYAAPEATALVGIHWDALRNSPFGDAVAAELSSSGPLGFPDLDCLKRAREVVVSSPDLLAAEAGSFPAAMVKDQAGRAGLHRAVYHAVTLWIPDAPKALGVAQISEQVILVGARKSLESAIDRSLMPTGRSYSSLLPRAARFSQSGDLWVVAVRLPDPLASLFVPLEVEGFGFAGQVSLRDGLTAEASFDAPSTSAAAAIAAQVKDQAQALPALAAGLDATSDRRTVNIELQASAEEMAAAMRPSSSQSALAAAPASAAPAAARPAPAAGGQAQVRPDQVGTRSAQVATRPAQIAAGPVPAAGGQAQVAAKPAQVAAKPAPAVVAAAPAHATAKFAQREPEPPAPSPTPQIAAAAVEPTPKPAPKPPPQPAGPQVVHIIGLDDGPREIVLPALPGN